MPCGGHVTLNPSCMAGRQRPTISSSPRAQSLGASAGSRLGCQGLDLEYRARQLISLGLYCGADSQGGQRSSHDAAGKPQELELRSQLGRSSSMQQGSSTASELGWCGVLNFVGAAPGHTVCSPTLFHSHCGWPEPCHWRLLVLRGQRGMGNGGARRKPEGREGAIRKSRGGTKPKKRAPYNLPAGPERRPGRRARCSCAPAGGRRCPSAHRCRGGWS